MARKLRFSLEFMDAFAGKKLPGMRYAGVVYDHGERPELIRQLPNDGVDIQDERVYWDLPLPGGGCICKCLLELLVAQKHELAVEEDAYRLVAAQVGFDVAGVPDSEEDSALFDDYRRNGDLGLRPDLESGQLG